MTRENTSNLMKQRRTLRIAGYICFVSEMYEVARTNVQDWLWDAH